MRQALFSWCAQWLHTVRIELSSQLAYKLNFLLLVIGPALVFFGIKLNLWWSVFVARNYQTVAGYSLTDMVKYQALVLIVTLLCQSYANRNISDDIRFGRISAFLLYPFGFISYHLGSFGASQVLNSITAALVLGVLLLFGIFPIASVSSLCTGLLLTFFVSFLWFFVWFVLSSSAFWLEESWVLRVLFAIIARFLSGAVIPLDLFPDAFKSVLPYTPFPYLTFVPVQVLGGTFQGSVLHACLITFGWTIAAGLIAWRVWQRGIRLYSAAGI